MSAWARAPARGLQPEKAKGNGLVSPHASAPAALGDEADDSPSFTPQLLSSPRQRAAVRSSGYGRALPPAPRAATAPVR